MHGKKSLDEDIAFPGFIVYLTGRDAHDGKDLHVFILNAACVIALVLFRNGSKAHGQAFGIHPQRGEVYGSSLAIKFR